MLDAGEMQLELVLRNELAEIDRLAEAVEAFCEKHAVPPDTAFHLNLVLEELVTNIVSYGYDEAEGRREIRVRLALDAQSIVVDVIDDARPFDPLSVPEPDLDASVESRAIGGLGVHFLRTLMRDLCYRRENGQNHLTFRKPLAEGDPAA